MNTKPTNTNACDHDWRDSEWEPGLQVCAWPWCGAVREAPAVVREGVDVPRGFVAERAA